MLFLATVSIALLNPAATAAVRSSYESPESAICGHHDDVWGFSVDLPAGRCADGYLHGIALQLSAANDAFNRSIVIFAMANSAFLRSAADVAKAHVTAARALASGPITVVGRSTPAVGGEPGERWAYRYREKESGRERFVDLVTVLRPVRPARGPLDYYEYSFSLETTPELVVSERAIFESLLKSVAFSTPER
jgi:hypothetical protein